MESDLSLSESLLRQRRNLLITSLLLFFLHQSGASIEGLSISGANIKLSNPKAIYQGLWLLFFYFNFRYFQHYLDEGRHKLNSKWDEIFANNARELTNLYVRDIAAKTGVGGSPEHLPSSELRKSGFLSWQVAKHSIYWLTLNNQRVDFPYDVPIPLKVLWRPIVRTCYEVIVLRSIFTNYALPFIFSAFVLGTCGFSEWPGSVLVLFM